MGLKGLTINTPPEDPAHIFAEDDAAIFQSIAGEDGVFTLGQQCKATTLSNNKIRIADGVVIIGGHFARIPYGEYEDCEIENGESGKKRNDIIVAVFETTGTGGIDKMHCIVKKGVAGSAAVDPELKQDDIYNNGKIRELPLYRVKIEGLSIVAVEQLFTILPNLESIKGIADYVVEEGRNGETNYRKWNSGIMEQWIETTVTGIKFEKYSSSPVYLGKYYWRDLIPFKRVKTAICGMFKYSTGGSWGSVNSIVTSEISIIGYDFFQRDGKEPAYIQAYAIGTWK